MPKTVRRASSRETLSSVGSSNSSILNRTLLTPEPMFQGVLGRNQTTRKEAGRREDSYEDRVHSGSSLWIEKPWKPQKLENAAPGSLQSDSKSSSMANGYLKGMPQSPSSLRQAQNLNKPTSFYQNVSTHGSPFQPCQSVTPLDVTSSSRSFFEQLSKPSTELSSAQSSTQNLFPWDPTYVPKSFVLKGSPRAKGHRRGETTAHVSFVSPFNDLLSQGDGSLHACGAAEKHSTQHPKTDRSIQCGILVPLKPPHLGLGVDKKFDPARGFVRSIPGRASAEPSIDSFVCADSRDKQVASCAWPLLDDRKSLELSTSR